MGVQLVAPVQMYSVPELNQGSGFIINKKVFLYFPNLKIERKWETEYNIDEVMK